MPKSVRRRTAALRRRYTGEDSSAVGRALRAGRPALGLDDCAPPQRALRALLALGWFNSDLDTQLGRWCAYGLFSYTLVPSPRYDGLVINTNWAEGVVRWLVPGGGDWPGRIPGMRLESGNGCTWRLRHLPTDATLIITQKHRPTEREDNFEVAPAWIRPSNVALTKAEYDALEAVPAMSPAAARLLGALPARIALRDPGHTWAVGGWWDDPLDRTPGRSVAQGLRRLEGHGDHWQLAWIGYRS